MREYLTRIYTGKPSEQDLHALLHLRGHVHFVLILQTSITSAFITSARLDQVGNYTVVWF